MNGNTEGVNEVLRITELSKSYGGLKAMDGVSFAVNRGEVMALVGDNGAGKSTLVKALSGAQPPDSGQMKPLVNRLSCEARAMLMLQVLVAFNNLWESRIPVLSFFTRRSRAACYNSSSGTCRVNAHSILISLI